MLKLFEQASHELCQYENKNKRKMAIIYAFASQIFFVTMFTCVGMLRKGYTTQEIVQGRQCIGFILNFIFCYLQKIPIYPKNTLELKLMIVRGVVGGIAMLLVFESFKLLNLSDAIVVTNTNPIWTTFLASIFLGENLSKKSVIFCFISFIGIVLIIKPAFIFGEASQQHQIESRNQVLGVLIALVGAICISFIQIVVSKMQKQMKLNNAQVLMYSYFFSCIISGIAQLETPNNEFQATSKYLCLISIIALLGFIAQLFFSRSFTLEKASIISPLQYTEVILSFMIDIFFFNEQIFLVNVIGSLLVVVGSIAIII
ncbi:hypothetical protein ABPG74_002128 [Tetrahymena malaccensis]